MIFLTVEMDKVLHNLSLIIVSFILSSFFWIARSIMTSWILEIMNVSLEVAITLKEVIVCPILK